jgi:hypothetical protein
MSIPGNNSYAHVNANSSGVAIKAGGGTFHGVTINTKGATANLLTIYDGTSTSGAVIAVIDTTATVGQLQFDIQFLNGLFYVLAAGTAADLTFSFQ